MSDDRVRIFVSSPADVERERSAVKDIVERLAREYLPYFPVQAVLWEEEALTADRTFQAGLTQPADCEIVLVILWTRLGSPLPEEPYRGMTGTEWEFFNAVEASVARGTPEVLVYKKSAPKLVDITDAAAAREAVEDRRRLDEFFRENFFNADNTFRRAFRTFDSDAAFRELVEVQLRKLLNRRISAERRAFSGALHWQGSPFRPDRPFDSTDERVFTGREGEIRELLSRLEPGAEGHRGFLLLSGAAGSGKTSLLRAGLLPRLARPFLFENIATVRCALVDWADETASPLAALARRLCATDVLGDALAQFGLEPARLERLLASEPDVAAAQLASGLKVLAKANESDARARLAVILDTLEALFERVGDEELHVLARALRGLAAHDGIWVIVAMRSDALCRLADLPELRALTDAGAWTALEPPPASRIRQVIEIPARIAGIELEAHEGDAGHSLVARIEADAGALRMWPPPVQGVLDAAYREARRRGATDPSGALRLSPEGYVARGGLRGHVLERARALWEDLDEETRAALPRLCRALIGSDGGAAQPVARAGDLVVLRADAACRRLVDRLIDARLIVAEGVRDPSLLIDCERPDYRLAGIVRTLWRQSRDEWQARLLRGARRAESERTSGTADPQAAADEAPADADGPIDWRGFRGVASFVHPVLIREWVPVQQWLREPQNRRFLQLRSQLTRQAQLWKRTDCNREYLYREVGYAQAQELLRAAADELEPLEQDFLAQSAANLSFLRKRNRLVRGIGIMLLGLLTAATLAAAFAFSASREARVNLHRSKLKEADIFIGRGNTPQAVRNAVEAGEDLPQKAIQTLSLAFSSNRLLAMTEAPVRSPDEPLIPAFSADGEVLATIDPETGVRRWRLERGRFVPDRELGGVELGLHTLFIGDRDQIYGVGRNGVWRLPAPADAQPLYPCGAAPAPTFALDPQRRYLALARALADGRFGVCVLDLALPGAVVVDAPLHDAEIRGLAFSPDGGTLLTAGAEGRTHAVDLDSGSVVLSLPEDGPLGRPFNAAVFDASGERIAIAAVDERVRLYGADGNPLGELAESRIGGQTFKIHRSAIRDVAFAPDGDFLVAVDDEGQVVRWALDASRQAVVLGAHELSVGDVAIAPHEATDRQGGHLVLTASLDMTARLWDLETAKQIAMLGHDGAVASAAFGKDGQRVLTYSERDGTVRLWSVDPVSGLAFKLRHPDHVWNLDMAAAPAELAPAGDELLLATAGFDGGVRVWRYDRSAEKPMPEPLRDVRSHSGRVRQVQFSASGRRLASAGYDGKVGVGDLVTGRSCEVALATASGGDEVYNALFGPDETWILTTSNDVERPVRVFSAQDCLPLDGGKALAHGTEPVPAAAVRQVGDIALIATGDEAGTLRVLQTARAGAWSRRCEAALGIGGIGDVAIASDGSFVAAAGSANHALLIPIGGGGCGPAVPLIGHSGRVYSIAIAPDADQVLTASLDKSARVWDRSGSPRAVLLGHQDRIYRAAFSPDGRWMLTASRDGSIRVWRTPEPGGTEERLTAFLPLRADMGGVANAAFSPDGHYVAGAYWENAALLWRLWTEDDNPPEGIRARWGEDRARLALIAEAYRFRDDNKVAEGDASVDIDAE